MALEFYNLNLITNFLFLFDRLGSKKRFQLFGLTLLMLITALLEVFSIGAVLPFIGVLIDPTNVISLIPIERARLHLIASKPEELLQVVTVVFIGSILLAGASRILLVWANTRLAFSIGTHLGLDIYKSVLGKDFEDLVSMDSSELISGVTIKTNAVISGIMTPILTMVSSALILISIIATLLYISPTVTLLCFLGLGFTYALILSFTRARVIENGAKISTCTTEVVKTLQEGFGGIRHLIMDNNKPVFYENFSKTDLTLKHAQGTNVILAVSPKHLVETVGIVLIAILSSYLVRTGSATEDFLPVLGAVVLGAQRILPALQSLYASISSLRSSTKILQDVINLLDSKKHSNVCEESNLPLSFQKSISLRDVSFKYKKREVNTVKNISVEILKGSRIGIIGATGSGKTTLVDLIMGLLTPTSGEIVVDNTRLSKSNMAGWMRQVAHVPQSVFLRNDTIIANVAFGVPNELIDISRVQKAIEIADLASFIDGLDEGLNAKVGERGALLSGGQVQRIGIARAFYADKEIFIFDEATSALDHSTEKRIIQNIAAVGDNKTIIIVAHKPETLQNCSNILMIERGHLVKSLTYGEFATSPIEA